MTGTTFLDEQELPWIRGQLLSESHSRLPNAPLGRLLHDQWDAVTLDDGGVRESVLVRSPCLRGLGEQSWGLAPKVREMLGLKQGATVRGAPVRRQGNVAFASQTLRTRRVYDPIRD
jgi:hypothetical protein